MPPKYAQLEDESDLDFSHTIDVQNIEVPGVIGSSTTAAPTQSKEIENTLDEPVSATIVFSIN